MGSAATLLPDIERRRLRALAEGDRTRPPRCTQTSIS